MRTVRTAATIGVLVALAFAAPAGSAPAALDDAQLSEALLTPEDMPGGGWETPANEVFEPEPKTQANDIIGGWCGGATDGYAAGELQAAGAASGTLQRVADPEAPYWFSWESLHSFQPAFGSSASAQAKSFMSTIETAATECESWTTSSGEITNTVSGAFVPFSKVGKQRFAVEITTSGDGVSEVTHAVYVRVKNHVVVVHTRILPTDTQLLTDIVKSAVGKVKRAVAAG
jgi:hypothetical protein